LRLRSFFTSVTSRNLFFRLKMNKSRILQIFSVDVQSQIDTIINIFRKRRWYSSTYFLLYVKTGRFYCSFYFHKCSIAFYKIANALNLLFFIDFQSWQWQMFWNICRWRYDHADTRQDSMLSFIISSRISLLNYVDSEQWYRVAVVIMMCCNFIS